MIKNNLYGNRIVYIAIKKEDTEKINDLLIQNNIGYNGFYKDGDDIFYHEESESILNRDEVIKSELSEEDKNSLVEDIYNDFIKNRDCDNDVFDHDFISEIEEKHLNKFMTRL